MYIGESQHIFSPTSALFSNKRLKLFHTQISLAPIHIFLRKSGENTGTDPKHGKILTLYIYLSICLFHNIRSLEKCFQQHYRMIYLQANSQELASSWKTYLGWITKSPMIHPTHNHPYLNLYARLCNTESVFRKFKIIFKK